ncbi:G-protein coupled receptor 1 [Capsicum annuum]|nr:G-protein coupled receptor 1 [Capsicum annuum]KAF3675690.1 G-protein coupled receptor 1 [Capsicum annuum]
MRSEGKNTYCLEVTAQLKIPQSLGELSQEPPNGGRGGPLMFKGDSSVGALQSTTPYAMQQEGFPEPCANRFLQLKYSVVTRQRRLMAVGMSERSYQPDPRSDMKALNRWGYYPLILIGSWFFGTINRIHDVVEPGHKIFWLSVLDVGMAQLMGLFNSIAYGLNSSVRRAIYERLDLIKDDEGDKDIVLGELEHSEGCRDFKYCRRMKVEANRRMCRVRATGPDEIPVEFWKYTSGIGLRWLLDCLMAFSGLGRCSRLGNGVR